MIYAVYNCVDHLNRSIGRALCTRDRCTGLGLAILDGRVFNRRRVRLGRLPVSANRRLLGGDGLLSRLGVVGAGFCRLGVFLVDFALRCIV